MPEPRSQPALHHLPLLDLTAEEVAALHNAARAWVNAGNDRSSNPLAAALDKLTTREETARADGHIRLDRATREEMLRLRTELHQVTDALADCVVKAVEYGEQEGGFVAFYLLPTGPIHRAIPLLQERHGITVRPGFDGRTHATITEETA